MKYSTLNKTTLVLIALLLNIISVTHAQVEKFIPNGESVEVWRITHNPTIRDWANYQNTQCWSPDGRYIAYTHFASDGIEFGTRKAAEVHIYDLFLDKDIKIDNGIEPRWANNHNWLFYVRNVTEMRETVQSNAEVMWYDLDTKVLKQLTKGVSRLRETDADDRWLYGLLIVDDGQRRAVRIALEENSHPEILPGEGAQQYSGKLTINPKHPVMVFRDHAYPDYNFSTENEEIPFSARYHVRADLDGNNKTESFPLMEGSHFSWSGDGTYFLAGNGIMRGIRWDEFLPGNIHFLAPIRCGDICKAGFSGRWICGSTFSGRGPLAMADLRSGDGWLVMKTHSVICYPGTGDNSGPYDIDAKGSPDGTKIVFVSNYDLKDGPHAVLSQDAIEDKITVNSTAGFPKKGRLVAVTGFEREVLQYKRKTPTTFEKLTRGLYGTPVSSPEAGHIVTSFESRLIPKKLQKNLPLASRRIRHLIDDEKSPLLKQRSSDVYSVVVRKPDSPLLQLTGDQVELIPGENHWETRGYQISMNGQNIGELLKPGDSMVLNNPGSYTAVAVEWSGLESEQSHPVALESELVLNILTEQPVDFSWTLDRWSVDNQPVEKSVALQAELAIKEIAHVYDGVIHREWYEGGEISKRFDLNIQGKPIRRLYYEDGILARRELHHRDGRHVSTEYFDSAGNITEAFHNALGSGSSYGYKHWWYEDTVPVKAIKGGVTYLNVGDKWIISDDD